MIGEYVYKIISAFYFAIQVSFFSVTFAKTNLQLLNTPVEVVDIVPSSYEDQETRKTITLEEALEKVLRANYDSQLKVERVYQAHHNVNVAIGRLLPSLNFSSIMALSTSPSFEVAASVLGFIFPSNWFNWRESTLYLRAQKTMYATLLANLANLTESIYYKIQLLKYSKDILNEYIARTKFILEEIKIYFPDGSPVEQAIYETNNFLYKLNGDRNLLYATLRNVEYEFLFTLGENPDKWFDISLEPFPLPDVEPRQPWETKDFLEEVYLKSQELETNRYLMDAAKFSTYARYFNFALPSTSVDSNLGFGYLSQIKVGKSRQRQFKILYKRTKARIRLQVEKTVQNYNLMLLAYRNAVITKANGERQVAFLLESLRKKKHFDDNYLDGLSFALRGDINYLNVKHAVLTLDAQKRRLLWKSERYQQILHRALKKKPKKTIGIRRALENTRIKTSYKDPKSKLRS